jgi:hypothetical protein
MVFSLNIDPAYQQDVVGRQVNQTPQEQIDHLTCEQTKVEFDLHTESPVSPRP